MSGDTEDLLRGKTLQIYWYLLTHGSSGIREIQKELKIPSPSTVSYHINKLVQAELVIQSEKTGKYLVKSEVKEGIMGLYIKIGRKMIPRMLLYLSFFSIGSLLSILIILFKGNITPVEFLFLLFSLSAAGIFIYETYKMWNMKPL
ncbi:MAG: winged helix-turn-helix transcriptional regulator [Candidatus Heimdallarchaeota archaeon]|nr:MAG: winged helix-turn-helix transcriptional regulator [Candidatus Heimdallarchaeota archaeon]